MKKIFLGVIFSLILILLVGCGNQADKVSYNLSQEADNFNVYRRVTVINGVTNDTSLVVEGYLSITKDNADNQLEIIVETGANTYQKHFIGLSNNSTYIVEDLGNNTIDRYNYVINLNPKMWIPWDIKTVD